MNAVTLQHQHNLGAVALKAPVGILKVQKGLNLVFQDHVRVGLFLDQEFTASRLTKPILICPGMLLLLGSSLLQGSELLVQQML